MDCDLLLQVGIAGYPAPAGKGLLLGRRIPSEFLATGGSGSELTVGSLGSRWICSA